jgi:hypothetical protein
MNKACLLYKQNVIVHVVVSCLRKSLLFGRFTCSPLCPSGKNSTQIKMSVVEHWWNVTEREDRSTGRDTRPTAI